MYKFFVNKKKKWAVSLKEEVEKFLKNKKIRHNIDVVIGGDGTILHYKNDLKDVIIGIGSNRSGLCVNRKDWKRFLASFIEEPRWKEAITLKVGDFKIFNDVVVRTIHPDAQPFEIFVNNKKLTTFGDGVLIFTPLGSSAYAKALGGPLLDRELNVIGIYSIAPFKNPIKLITKTDNIKIKSKQSFYVSLDGQNVYTTKSVNIKKNDKKIKIYLKEML